jgi:hypothetical protein
MAEISDEGYGPKKGCFTANDDDFILIHKYLGIADSSSAIYLSNCV